MGERAVDFSFDTFIFIILIAIVLIIVGIIYVNATSVGEKSKFAGAPGVVRADSADIIYDKTTMTSTRIIFSLNIINLEHEEGNIVNVVPVLWFNNALFRPLKDGSSILPSSYQTPGDIEGVFIINMPLSFDPTKALHISLWESACLEKTGFTASISLLSYQELVKECSGSYLASFYIIPKENTHGRCYGLSHGDCNVDANCYWSSAESVCKSCNSVASICSSRSQDECFSCPPPNCYFISADIPSGEACMDCINAPTDCTKRRTLFECSCDNNCRWDGASCLPI